MADSGSKKPGFGPEEIRQGVVKPNSGPVKPDPTLVTHQRVLKPASDSAQTTPVAQKPISGPPPPSKDKE